MRLLDDASLRQIEAANPRASTWLSANAGSGKTKVLIDRVALSLLEGVEPARILCLTYTKAAASEMQVRLFERLGKWAMSKEAALRDELVSLGVEAPFSAEKLAAARQLFARAIETPGGLRIQTIHSFCASLLRRFPLEAGVSPLFIELDERSATLMREEIVDDMAQDKAAQQVADMAAVYANQDFDTVMQTVIKHQMAFHPPKTAQDIWKSLGLDIDFDIGKLVGQVFLGNEANLFSQIIPILRTDGVTMQRLALVLAGINAQNPGFGDYAALKEALLVKTGQDEGQPKKNIPSKKSSAEMGDLKAPLIDLMNRLSDARDQELALLAAQRNLALHRFAQAFLPLYHQRKSERAALDFDDLITRAGALLTDPSVAQWVLFRLDGGVDHILVDEAQDTSPAQWKVIELLAQEFTAGKGARDIERTIFVVGDKKQSIYSFQGADVGAFERMKLHFATRLSESNQALQDLALEHSFRSAPAILRLVDNCFDINGRNALGGSFRHLAHKVNMPGLIELWPAIDKSAAPEQGAWDDPVDLVQDTHHSARLGLLVAERIDQIIKAGTVISVKGTLRPVHEGDFLILVRSRSQIFIQIIRACKSLGLAVAGADRLNLSAELAVKDVAALLAFLATPEDCLSLAEALRSPLFGLSEVDLFKLAHNRTGYLWTSLRQSDQHPEALAILTDLRDQSDYLRPYDIIERVLTRHQGRQRLLTRLGLEAEDGIDALLTQALTYEQTEVPSLTGFLAFLQTDDVQLKRQMDSAGRQIRVMSVHGAKGLEAPIVILPDCADRPTKDSDELILLENGLLSWKTAKSGSPKIIDEARGKRRALALQEESRLLYVALTRAQSHLIVAAAGKVTGADAWYNQISAAMLAIGAETQKDGRLVYAEGVWPDPMPTAPIAQIASLTLPNWALCPAPKAQRPEQALSPSSLGGVKSLDGPIMDTDLDATTYGTLLHLLLEHLPRVNPHERLVLANNLLGSALDAKALKDEALALLDNPSLAAIFSPTALAEVALTARVDGVPILGKVDRLIIAPDHILAVDFKSNRQQPKQARDIPLGLLAQMRAYSLALAQIYPKTPIKTAILWTKTGELMPIDPVLFDALPPIGTPVLPLSTF